MGYTKEARERNRERGEKIWETRRKNAGAESKADYELTARSQVAKEGTIGYVLKQHGYSNERVNELLSAEFASRPVELAQLGKLLDAYKNNIGDVARKRPSIWDELSRNFRLHPSSLFALIAEATFKYARSEALLANAETEKAIAEGETRVIKRLATSAAKEKNLDHTRLFLEASKRVGGEKGIQITNQVGVQVNEGTKGLPSVEDLTEEPIRLVREHRQKVLTEGKLDYVDTEVVSHAEPQTVP